MREQGSPAGAGLCSELRTDLVEAANRRITWFVAVAVAWTTMLVTSSLASS